MYNVIELPVFISHAFGHGVEVFDDIVNEVGGNSWRNPLSCVNTSVQPYGCVASITV